jgi:hypothetical protein
LEGLVAERESAELLVLVVRYRPPLIRESQ